MRSIYDFVSLISQKEFNIIFCLCSTSIFGTVMPAYKIFIIHFHLTNFCSINLKNNFTIILSAMIIFERQRRWYQLQLPKLLIIKLYNSKPLPSNLHRNSHNHTNHNNTPEYFKSQIIIRQRLEQRYFFAVEDVRHIDFSIQAT